MLTEVDYHEDNFEQPLASTVNLKLLKNSKVIYIKGCPSKSYKLS